MLILLLSDLSTLVLWINLSKGKIMVAMVIMVVEANNDGNNINWSFLVVLEGGCCFFGGCFLEDISVGGLFL